MQTLARHGDATRRGRVGVIVVVVVVVAIVAGALTWVAVRKGPNSPPAADYRDRAALAVGPSGHFAVVVTTPGSGAQNVASDAVVTIRFSAPLPARPAAGSAAPAFDPPVAGTWRRANDVTLAFDAAGPFVPSAEETLTIPGGPKGLRDAAGQTLADSDAVDFTVALGSEERLQQLLALTGYLPLSFTPTGPPPAPAAVAMPQPGTFNWRWPDLPTSLTSLWVEGQPSQIVKGAVMTVENQNGLTVDGLAGPEVWMTLLHDEADGTTDQATWDYVSVSKVLPENLTLWVNGAVRFSGIPVNTGVPGADTADGTFEVFEHVTASDMKGTNVDGTTYDDPNVPWASYFNGGDALHGFVRASYGFPQSNGCVEMSIADAGATWPYTPIGTLVTVAGPTAT
jgi:peptidoglycan hydrolase-like protein with peptidoglycan-binding domain